MTDFLPGVPDAAVLAALSRSPGNELASGKFDSPESSAALAVNAFGWFLERPQALPPLPGVPMGLPERVEVEAELHFPWRGGRHPWLDAAITTATTLVGVEAKRYEPFRPGKASTFSEAFDSRDWGKGMARYTALRLALTEGRQSYRCLDAVQLVKHACALRTQSLKRGLGAVLVYLHAAPATWASGCRSRAALRSSSPWPRASTASWKPPRTACAKCATCCRRCRKAGWASASSASSVATSAR